MNLREGFFDAGDISLHYVENTRDRPTLVLLHGATGSLNSWIPVLPSLEERWHVFAVDLRGHGKSGRAANPDGYHISNNVNDILAFLRERVKEPAVLIGHSWGGVISLLCGGPGKDQLRGLVLEDPPIYVRRTNQKIKPYIDYFTWAYEMKKSAHTIEEVAAAIQAANQGIIHPTELEPRAKTLLAVDANFLLSIMDHLKPVKGIDFERSIQEIACPILLLQADLTKDACLQPEDLDLVLKNARDAQVVRFPGAGHGIHDEQPANFLRVLDQFLQTL